MLTLYMSYYAVFFLCTFCLYFYGGGYLRKLHADLVNIYGFLLRCIETTFPTAKSKSIFIIKKKSTFTKKKTIYMIVCLCIHIKENIFRKFSMFTLTFYIENAKTFHAEAPQSFGVVVYSNCIHKKYQRFLVQFISLHFIHLIQNLRECRTLSL